jgi:threonine aldolase
MFFGSDNSSPAHPSILDALVDANKGYTSGYGHEEAMHNVTKKYRIYSKHLMHQYI